MKKEVKECSVCGDEKPIVNKTKTLCIKCNRERLDAQRPPKPKAEPKPRKPVKSVADKRKKESVVYEEVKRRKKRDQIEGGYYKCYFCNTPLPEEGTDVDAHHVLGRTGPLYTDYRNIFFAHRYCHTTYHDKDAVWLLQNTNWYVELIKRIKTINKAAYQAELRKLYKSGAIDIEILLNEF